MAGYDQGLPALMRAPEAAPGDLTRTAGLGDSVTLLTGYVCLLMAIPSSLVVGSLGAAGTVAGLFAVVLGAWYLTARLHPGLGLDRGRQPVRLALACFGCALVATYVSVNRVALPALRANGADRGMLIMTGWLAVALLAADGIASLSRLRVLVRRVVTGGTALALLGVAEFGTGVSYASYARIPGLSVHSPVTDLLDRNGLARVIATTAQPLEFSAVLAMCLPLALYQARFAPGRRVLRWVQVALIALAMPMTVSRSAILGLLVACLVLLPAWSRRDRRRAYLALMAGPLAIWMIRPSLGASFAELFSHLGTDTSSQSRDAAYPAATPYIAQHPWLGQGFQTFFPQTYFFIDNQYLTSLIETGAIGLAALLVLLVTGWCLARGARAASTRPADRDLGQSLAAAIVAGAACFATFDALYFSIAPGLWFVLLGMAGALWRLTSRARHDRQAR